MNAECFCNSYKTNCLYNYYFVKRFFVIILAAMVTTTEILQEYGIRPDGSQHFLGGAFFPNSTARMAARTLYLSWVLFFVPSLLPSEPSHFLSTLGKKLTLPTITNMLATTWSEVIRYFLAFV